MAKKSRGVPEINASSMADIAFLLLIFFLVTTTIDTDAGMLVKLPPWVEPEDLPPPDKANKHNVLEILVNQYDQLLVNGVPCPLNVMCFYCMRHADINEMTSVNVTDCQQKKKYICPISACWLVWLC